LSRDIYGREPSPVLVKHKRKIPNTNEVVRVNFFKSPLSMQQIFVLRIWPQRVVLLFETLQQFKEHSNLDMVFEPYPKFWETLRLVTHKVGMHLKVLRASLLHFIFTLEMCLKCCHALNFCLCPSLGHKPKARIAIKKATIFDYVLMFYYYYIWFFKLFFTNIWKSLQVKKQNLKILTSMMSQIPKMCTKW